MILLRCKGGLGNQMFQYAAAFALAARHGTELGIDTSWYGAAGRPGGMPRAFDLRFFRISARMVAEREARALGMPAGGGAGERRLARVRALLRGRRVFRNDAMGLAPEFARLGARVNLEGYFQHSAYFTEAGAALRKEFEPKAGFPREVEGLATRLGSESSVCIQVRRTDFVTDAGVAAVHGCVAPEYYRRAWDFLSAGERGLRGYVFTDDQDWARRHFADWPDVEVVGREWDGPAFLHRFQLMRRCRHHILANSTWGWWAAWLGNRGRGRVILPDEWLRGRSTRELGLLEKGWELVSGGAQ